MSSARLTRNNNMEQQGVLGLNDDEIQEELLNADLKALGINEDDLSNMETEEKRNLLTALKQSTSSQHQKNTSNQRRNTCASNDDSASCSSGLNTRRIYDKNEIDIILDSPEEYSSLPTPSANLKSNTSHSKQQVKPQQQIQKRQLSKLTKKQSEPPVDVISCSSNQEEFDDDDDGGGGGDDDYNDVVEEPDEEVEEEDEEGEDVDDDEEDDDDDDQPFNFPAFIDDNGCSLKQHARKKPLLRNVQYYMLQSQCSKSATRTMLKHYNSWYKDWCSLEKNNILPKDNKTSFIGNSLKDNTLKSNVEPSMSKAADPTISYSMKVTDRPLNKESPTSFEKASSPDVEEIEVTEIKVSEMSRLTPSSKAKTLPRETRSHHNPQTSSSTSSPTVDVNFDEKWDPDSGLWTTPRRCKRSYANSRPTRLEKEPVFQPKESAKVEEKVQCPICQLDFLQSKIENHAAVCEGFPCETRSTPATYSSKLEESNNKDGFTNTPVVELTTSEPKIANKKRVADNEDNQNNKRICVNRVQS